jgi:tight adherence protein B
MRGELNLLVAFGIFVTACAALIVIGLFVISVVLRAQAAHRRRLSRVGRKRLSGQLDFDEARLQLLRRREDTSAFVGIVDRLSVVIPLLDTERLKANIRRAGMTLSIGGFAMIAGFLALFFGVLGVFVLGYSVPFVAVASLLLGMFVADLGVKLRGEMMAERFMKQLPNALDTVIRGVRAGLPVLECIGNVGEEFDNPVGGHFQAVAERVRLGEPLDVALWRAAEVVDRPEMDFMAICISIQMETGGSLAEALNNLATLLRDRERMKLKIKAISSEAKASAMIIGALPFVMMALLYTVNPDYVSKLFYDPRGQTMLLFGMGSITLGAIVMWRMTKFEI